MYLVFLACAPVLIIAFYVYFRDKYEKEPARMLLKALLAGALALIPILFVGDLLSLPLPYFSEYYQVAYMAFVVAGLTEESFKFLFLFLLVWRSSHFNEKFDGIVYAVFVSLGFSAVENLMYVLHHGQSVGLFRALTAVPAHALFGVVMGYHLGIARMNEDIRTGHLMMAFLMPVLLHGVYDFILMSGHELTLLIFVPYLLYLWFSGFRKMKIISDASIFKPD
jgi:RsiW-degrading membrane proteinase PrsW (M82 family)